MKSSPSQSKSRSLGLRWWPTVCVASKWTPHIVTLLMGFASLSKMAKRASVLLQKGWRVEWVDEWRSGYSWGINQECREAAGRLLWTMSKSFYLLAVCTQRGFILTRVSRKTRNTSPAVKGLAHVLTSQSETKTLRHTLRVKVLFN